MVLFRAFFDCSAPVTFAAFPRDALLTAARFARWKRAYLLGISECRRLTHQMELVP